MPPGEPALTATPLGPQQDLGEPSRAVWPWASFLALPVALHALFLTLRGGILGQGEGPLSLPAWALVEHPGRTAWSLTLILAALWPARRPPPLPLPPPHRGRHSEAGIGHRIGHKGGSGGQRTSVQGVRRAAYFA